MSPSPRCEMDCNREIRGGLGGILEGTLCGGFGLDVVVLNCGGKVTDWLNGGGSSGKNFCVLVKFCSTQPK